MYYSHYTIIKFLGFEPVFYVINLSVVLSSMIFNEFVYVFPFIYYYFKPIKLFFFVNNNKEICVSVY